MRDLTTQELNMRIESFLTKKHQQYPELGLREDKEHKAGRHAAMDVLHTLIAGVRFQLNR